MVCSGERIKYPFDIQHRAIINYVADSSRDFEKLKLSITERIKAVLDNRETLRQIVETEQVAPVDGLSQAELVVLAVLAGSVYPPEEGSAGLWSTKSDAERAGLTAIGFSLGVRRLQSKGFIARVVETDHNNEPYEAARITDKGWAWIEANESKFIIRKPSKKDDLNDEIPF